MPPRKKKPDVSRETSEPTPDNLEPDEELQEFAGGVTIPVLRRNKGGRPPKYRPEYAIAAGIMLRRGATISELAQAFGVANSTIHFWQTQHQEFLEQFLQLSDATISRVERSLADRANGYTYDAVKVFNYKGTPVIIPVKEHVPPDISAIKHILAVKRPQEWRIKDEVELSGDEAFKELLIGMANKKKDAKDG